MNSVYIGVSQQLGIESKQIVRTKSGREITLITTQVSEDAISKTLQITAQLQNGQKIGLNKFCLVEPNSFNPKFIAGDFKIEVSREFQNQGIGTELYRAVMDIIGPEGQFGGSSATIATYFCKHKLGLPSSVHHSKLRERGIANHLHFANHIGFDSFEELRQYCKSISPK